jgi:LacI family transcriptional regulator
MSRKFHALTKKQSKKNCSRQEAVRQIAVLVDTSTTWGRAVLRGINTYNLKHGPWEIFVEARGMEEHLRVPRGWRGDGIIARVNTPEMARELQSLHIPVVNVSGIEISEAKFPRVSTDLKASAQLAAEYLLGRGFKHFAYFGLIGLDYVKAHREIFAATVKGRGGDFTWLAVKPVAGAEPDWSLDLKSLGESIKQMPRPLAMLCWNASSAREIIFACREVGLLVPEQVAVLSQANDEALCETSLVPISGIAVSGEGIGQHAAQMLDRLMQGKRPPMRAKLIAPLGVVTRQSTDTLAVSDPAVAKALSFLRRNANAAVRVNAVALQAGVSRRALERKFLDVLQRSPADEIRRLHLEHARRLLVESDLSMALVAEASGFGSQAYFADSFRRHFNATPFQYRKDNRVRTKGFK